VNTIQRIKQIFGRDFGKQIDQPGAEYDATTGMPSDWRKFHDDNFEKISKEKREAAVVYLRDFFNEEPEPRSKQRIKEQTIADPEWWAGAHFFWGMAIRNKLRDGGFTDDAMGMNLDDCYVAIVERAVGACPMEGWPR
jgi:hypothetical protein